MKEFEYNKVKIHVPQSWDDITLGHYETFYTEKPETARERVTYVAKVCKVDAELLLSWPADVFNRIVDYIDFLFKDNPEPPAPDVEIGDARYTVPIEDELSLGAWVDADEVQKKGENVLSNILAIVCRPPGEAYDCNKNEARAAMFAAQPVSKVLNVLAFFLHCKTVYDRRTAAYLNLARILGQLPKNIKPFQSLGGGTKLSLIWPKIKYHFLIVLLYARLRKYLRSYNTRKTGTTPKPHSVS